jgi:hypothetical protein
MLGKLHGRSLNKTAELTEKLRGPADGIAEWSDEETVTTSLQHEITQIQCGCWMILLRDVD